MRELKISNYNNSRDIVSVNLGVGLRNEHTDVYLLPDASEALWCLVLQPGDWQRAVSKSSVLIYRNPTPFFWLRLLMKLLHADLYFLLMNLSVFR